MAYTINKVDTLGYWMVGTTHLYTPSEAKIEHSNVVGESTGRSEDGIMRIDWIRRDVRKVIMKWRYMTAAELNTTMSLLQGKEFSNFKFFDQGSVQTISAYCGESSYEFYAYDVVGNKVYKDIEIHVIEK